MTDRHHSPTIRRSRRHGAASLAVLAPWASILALVALSVWLPNRTRTDDEVRLRMSAVADAMADVPRFIGAWTGIDEAVPPEAQKLLRPNAIMSRVYRRPGGPRVQVLLVHCRDARDMIGHYPPVCYPSSGWIPIPIEDGPASATIEVDGVALPVQVYHYRRVREGGSTDEIRIINAFVLPDGTVTRSKDDIDRQSDRMAVSRHGVAQLQIITDLDLDRGEAETCASELLGGMDDVLEALRVKQGEGS